MRIRYEFIFVIAFLGLLLSQSLSAGALAANFASFPLRDPLISAVTDFRLWMGDRVFHDVLVGKNGWLVYATTRSMDQFQNVHPLSDEELANYEKSLLEFNDIVQANGARLLFVTAPYKNTVYPENVPVEIQPIGRVSHLDQIINLVSRTPIPVLDLRPALFAAKRDAQIYYSTDTHWNDLGGFAAYRAILHALQPTFPQLTPHPLSDYTVSMQPPKIMDLSFIMGSASLDEERVQLRPQFKTATRSDSLVLPSGRQINFARNKDSSLPVALFFHDSYLYTLMPFLSEHFSRTFYVDMQAGNDMLPRAWVEQIQPDVVVIVLNEHFLDFLPKLLTNGRVLDP
jgi:hypothetical protein